MLLLDVANSKSSSKEWGFDSLHGHHHKNPELEVKRVMLTLLDAYEKTHHAVLRLMLIFLGMNCRSLCMADS